MAFLTINPAYRDLLGRHGLTCPERLAALPGLIVSGHPERHVARVTVGGMSVYLKREHRVRWRDRLLSAAAGFGFASLAVREAQTLAALGAAGLACPEWIAAGEDESGRAFLLLAALPGAVDLRQYLRDRRGVSPSQRYRFAASLGAAVAAFHEAGFDHPDLYAKHVLVDPATGRCHFLDWQRSRRRTQVGWRTQVRDLAALDATLSEELATVRERLAFLCGYFGEPRGVSPWLVRMIRDHAARLLRRRHVRGERISPPPLVGQGVVWLDGEALCVTQEFWEELGGDVPAWLPLPADGLGTWRGPVMLPGGRRGLLVRRWCDRPLAWLWSILRGRRLLSPELRDAGRLFRLRKHGLPAPRVLAFGQCRSLPWRTASFLLTEVEGPHE